MLFAKKNGYMSVIAGRNFLDPFAASEAPDAPDGLGDLVGLQEEVDPEGRQVEDKAGQHAQRERHRPQEDIVGEHEYFCIAATAEDALGHDAVRGLEDDDQADRVQ